MSFASKYLVMVDSRLIPQDKASGVWAQSVITGEPTAVWILREGEDGEPDTYELTSMAAIRIEYEREAPYPRLRLKRIFLCWRPGWYGI